MDAFICIAAALSDELAGIKQRMAIRRRRVWGPVTVFEGEWQNYGVLLVRTGIGRQRALDAVRRVLDHYTVVLLLSVGYAGGTDPEVKLGDLVLADRVLRREPEASPPWRTLPLDPALVNQAMLLSCPDEATLHRGGLLTLDAVVTDPAEKAALGKEFQVAAVDMETFDLVDHARRNNLPVLSVRAISDTVDQPLADLTHLLKESGEPDLLKAGWHVLTHPGDLKQALSLRAQTRLATDHLTRFLADYLRYLK